MKRRSGVLLVVGAVLATATISVVIERSAGRRQLDLRPTTRSGDPRGLLAAYRYLEARGETERVERNFALAARFARVLVIAGPTQRALLPDEAEAAARVAERGGALVVIAPDGEPLPAVQPALAERLGISHDRRRGGVPVERLPGRDPSEVVTVWEPDPILGAGRRFLAQVRRGVELTDGTALAGTGDTAVIVRRSLGYGVVYVIATPSLLENHRIDLADNAHLLEGLLGLSALHGGKVVFDEEHHLDPEPLEGGSILSHPAMIGTLVQLVAAAGVLLMALSRRFGPVRPLISDPRRSTLEYVDTLAALYARAGEEDALCQEVHRDFRHRLFERYGISTALDEAAAARRLEARTGLSAREYLAAVAVFTQTPRDLAACVRTTADLESRLSGRKVA